MLYMPINRRLPEKINAALDIGICLTEEYSIMSQVSRPQIKDFTINSVCNYQYQSWARAANFNLFVLKIAIFCMFY